LIAYETSQIGTGDVGGNNNVECNRWFYYDRTINGSGYPWCQTFQSWCAYKVGISETVIPKTAYCPTAVNWFKNKQEFHLSNYYGGNYTPKAGDLVYYGANGGDHVGLIIASPVGGYLQVIEGNVRDDATGNYTVQKFTANRKRRVDSSYVYGYASPQYQ
jgi:hypothetical protein